MTRLALAVAQTTKYDWSETARVLPKNPCCDVELSWHLRHLRDHLRLLTEPWKPEMVMS
jgi:hypothetical protein